MSPLNIDSTGAASHPGRTLPLPSRILTSIRCTICHTQLYLDVGTDSLIHREGPLLYAWGRHAGKPSREHDPCPPNDQSIISRARRLAQEYLARLPR